MEITRLAKSFCSVAICLILISTVAQAQNLTTLYSFSNSDGANPAAGLVQGSNGNFYGTTAQGGTPDDGTVFQITPSGTLTTLYNFQGSNGNSPWASLIQASDGNFYGTTTVGGSPACPGGCGVVFQITPSGGYTVLYGFSRTDGSQPEAGLMQATDGNLYGTTFFGGVQNSGTIFKLSLSGTLTTLHSFCSQPNCTDGKWPAAALVQGSDGNLYGMTQNGGTSGNCNPDGCGTVFQITPAGALTTLHSFAGSDGSSPVAPLIQANDGNFYGTTGFGGANSSGTVFKVTPSGTLTTLYNFCSANNCADGAKPDGALLQIGGNFYGTAAFGGTANDGVIFSITPSGAYTLLHNFSGPDGEAPAGALVQGSDRNFYGTTFLGGANNYGTVFSLALAMQFVPVTPCRVVDTRNPDGTFGGPYISGNSSRDFPLPLGACNIPSTATAYSLNATVIPRGALGYITVWPSGFALPLVSTMNSYDGRVKADALVVSAGDAGGVSVYASDATDAVLDINGYFQLAGMSTLAFYPVAPCRVVDTRNPNGPLGGPYISGNTSREFPVLSSDCGLPNSALAYSMNFTAVPHGPLGYLTVWPSDQQQPYVSTLNAYSGQVTANAAIVSAADNGDISAFVSDDSDLVIDVNGYFAPAGANALSLYTLAPCRVLDTRNGSGVFSGELTVNVQGSACPVSSSAQAYIFNATVVPPGPLGYLSLWADSQQQPFVSTLNAYDGAVTANMAIVPTVNGLIDAFASNSTNLILDITSYFAP